VRLAGWPVAEPVDGGALIVELSDEEMRLYDERNELPARYACKARTARTLVVLPQEDGQDKRDEEAIARARAALMVAQAHECSKGNNAACAEGNENGAQV